MFFHLAQSLVLLAVLESSRSLSRNLCIDQSELNNNTHKSRGQPTPTTRNNGHPFGRNNYPLPHQSKRQIDPMSFFGNHPHNHIRSMTSSSNLRILFVILTLNTCLRGSGKCSRIKGRGCSSLVRHQPAAPTPSLFFGIFVV